MLPNCEDLYHRLLNVKYRQKYEFYFILFHSIIRQKAELCKTVFFWNNNNGTLQYTITRVIIINFRVFQISLQDIALSFGKALIDFKRIHYQTQMQEA